MSERSHLVNGRFLHDLSGWTLSGAEYSAGDGDDHYGVAVLAAGEYIEQAFGVSYIRTYTLAIDVKPVGNDLAGTNVQAILTDGNGNTVASLSMDGTADTWTANSNDLGLASGTTYTLKIINNDFGADVRIDDVWLWDVPITRAEIASHVNTKLGRLASDRSLSTTPSGTNTEGDYTFAVDAGLRGMGAVNPETGLPDVRYLDPSDVNGALDLVMREMLEYLQADYAVETDIRVGPYQESRKQIGDKILTMLGKNADGSGGSAGQVIQRKLGHQAKDYDLG